jgi:hypothetical protein
MPRQGEAMPRLGKAAGIDGPIGWEEASQAVEKRFWLPLFGLAGAHALGATKQCW